MPPLEQKALQLQMNPHFIFNALNSIKVFLIENDKEQAIFYLNKFSKLIRKILESSRIKEVSLNEELDTIKLYLGIESMRFDSDVKIDISIMKSVDIKKINLPPLILQPFVENAIWHGLMLRKGEKKISIDVYKSEQSIFLSLKDNGIGRKQSEENIQRKRIKKESLGLKMTKERINYYNQKQGTNYSYKIKDLYDDSDNPSGTEVIFAFN
jgi:LytS/YehU family sensor histidine kinase